MSDTLQKLIKDMDQPLTPKAVAFLKELDNLKPEFFTAEFLLPEDPLKADQGYFRFEYALTLPKTKTLEIPWAPKLEAELYKRHITMAKPEQEAARAGMLLVSNMRYSDIRFGKEYSSAVLIELIEERFGDIEVVRSLLSKSRNANPSRGNSYSECRSYLKSCLDGLGNSLIVELYYKNNTAFSILVGAIVVLLDQRFHITLRNILFPKK